MPGVRRVVLGALVLILALSAAVWWLHWGSQSRRDRALARYLEEKAAYTTASTELTGMVPRRLSESSGVAVSRTYPGVLWTHNDSGHDPVVFAMSLGGQILGAFSVQGAESRDWEDISLGRCPDVWSSESDCLYIGDIGDNRRRRSVYSLYIIPEPNPTSVEPTATTTVAEVRRVDFVYPDERHDAEAMAVSPDGDVTIVTKGRNGRTQVFVIHHAVVEQAIRQNRAITPESRGTLAIDPAPLIGKVVTGAAFSPSGRILAVRTYTEIYLYTVGEDGELLPPAVPCFVGIIEPGGEAVDFLDEETLVLTSEWSRGQQGTIYRVRC